jgi:hypothetical protein
LSPELELTDIDARHWRNGWHLLVPPRVRKNPRWALVVLEGGIDHVCKVLVAGSGNAGSVPSASVKLAGLGPAHLAALTRALGVSAVVILERGVLAELSGTIEAALRNDHDGVEQVLVALRAIKHMAGVGIWTEPPILDLLPAPAYEPLQRTFDLLVPDGSALVVYVVDDDRQRVHTSVIAVKNGGDITRVATHRAIVDLVPEASLARDWHVGHRRVLAAVEERFAKPSLGVFLERKTLIEILTGPADQLARELNARRVVLDPAPTWLLGLLGGAAVAAMAGRAASALASMLPHAARERASALAQRARDAIDPFALLGFDPIELWQRLKHYYRP